MAKLIRHYFLFVSCNGSLSQKLVSQRSSLGYGSAIRVGIELFTNNSA